MVDRARLHATNASLIIMGDFNDLETDEIERHTSLSQIVKEPTRESAILDKILTDLNEDFCDPQISTPIASSDHNVVTVLPCLLPPPRKSTRTSHRPFRESSVRAFGQWVQQMDWSIIGDFDANDMASEFNDLINTKFRQYFELVTVKRRLDDEPWMNDEIRRTLNGHVQRLIDNAKDSFYQRKVEHLKKSEPGKWHQQIRHLAGIRKKQLNLSSDGRSDIDIANELNTHFAAICSSLPPLDRGALSAFLPAPSPPPVIDRRRVYKRLCGISTAKACHPNDPPSRLLKEFAYELSEPLTTLFNLCLSQGCFPDIWKHASISAIPKTNPVTSYDQLRPISITPTLARIFEGFLADWIMSSIRPFVDHRQFGNLRGSSVTHYLVSLLDTIHRGLDKGGTLANLCVVDFSKAFDHVNHTIVMNKLIDLGVDHSIIPTICSFLSNRAQTVRYHGKSSQQQAITCGVPQGIRLGPVLFLVLINDAALESDNRWKYVDDLTIVEVLKKTHPSELQSQLDSLIQWCKDSTCLDIRDHKQPLCKHRASSEESS
ncbi:uncharacterized protein LOC115925216 [Strongylocentrotus purpuratus]|uniref:Reverse transcriptase domain-containing protein n=1 Tax=Strongylocentrotus purpuratus TaxID=7668 RepID=A0A7M7P159_STRPU|nr:uncharacterized protein LOC115925216 [Strongylocentrotus purpuratus]